MRLALSAPDRIIIATQDGAHAVLNGLPANLATQSWPTASETGRLASFIHQRLTNTPKSIRNLLAANEARSIAAVFREESQIPEARPLPENCSVPAGIASQSIGNRFVGRANDLRTIHQFRVRTRRLCKSWRLGLEINKRLLGEQHPITLTSMNNLANTLRSQLRPE